MCSALTRDVRIAPQTSKSRRTCAAPLLIKKARAISLWGATDVGGMPETGSKITAPRKLVRLDHLSSICGRQRTHPSPRGLTRQYHRM